MHTSKILYLNDNCHYRTGMAENAQFIVTNVAQRSDLGQCLISTTAPHLVAKIHTFKTSVKNPRLAETRDNERRQYFMQREESIYKAEEAANIHISIQKLTEQQGRRYDEEYDEQRPVVKVPGCNVYLELYGCLDVVDDISSPDILAATAERLQCNPSIAAIMLRMSTWMRTWMDEDRRRDTATTLSDWQPVDEWKEQYDPREFFYREPEKGIGIDQIDPSRRPERYARHSLSAKEKYYYGKILNDAENKGMNITAAQAQQQAIAMAHQDDLMNDMNEKDGRK